MPALREAGASLIRQAVPADAAAVARIWHDAHDGHVPPGLAAARTRASFDQRADALVPRALVAEVDGEVVGFATVLGEELELLFVAGDHRGTGVAGLLLSAAEQQGARWLSVVVGNARARRFYERHGYVDTGPDDEPVTVAGTTYVVVGRRYVRVAGTSGPAGPTSRGR